jgi:crotonobetainyl-CoA:carnitine CoA-transferase CaiB-like acyl-CoA transferase
VLQEKLMIWCKAQRFAALEQAVVPAGLINTVEEALADPKIVARGLQIAPEGMPGLRIPLRFSRSGLVLDRAAPHKS